MRKFIFGAPLLFILLHWVIIKITLWQLPVSLVQKKVTIQGTIDSIPEKKPHGFQFQFHAIKINQKKINTHFLIHWYGYSPKLNAGQQWQLTVKLKPPLGSHNPNGFDYAQFLLAHRITATGYVMTRANNQLLGMNDTYFLDHFRQHVQQQINMAVPNHAIAAFISALSVGLRFGLTESDWQVFQKTGTNHLIAIAGLHIGFVFMTLYFFSERIIKYFPNILLRVSASLIAQWVACFGAILYACLSGFAIPAQRAAFILFLSLVTRTCYVRVHTQQKLLLAAEIILLINPLDCVDISFWLSFSSIAILSWIMSGRLRSPNRFILWIKMQSGIVLGLLPLMLFSFQQASLIACVTNAIAIPWIGFFILPLCLIAMILFALHLSLWSHFLFSWIGDALLPLWKALEYVSQWPFSSWHHAVVNPFILVLSMVSGFYLLAPRGLPARWLGCFGCVPLFFLHPTMLSKGDYRVTVMDVGEGLSVLVQTAHHVTLYDTGGHYPGGFDAGESIVAPYLRTEGITRINRLVIADANRDDSGGSVAIIHDFHVDSVMSVVPKWIKQFHADNRTDDHWRWDGVDFQTIGQSSVIKINGKGGSFLLTGELTTSTESDLVAQYADVLHSTVLLVPHHGGSMASSLAFIHAVSPEYALISAGKYNRYHFPANSVVARYGDANIHLYNTANCGAITVRFQGQGQVKLSTFLPFSGCR